MNKKPWIETQKLPHGLNSRDVGLEKVLNLDLSIARNDKEYEYFGKFDFILMNEIEGKVYIRLNSKKNDLLPLHKLKKIERTVEKFYITNTAQKNRIAKLIIGGDFKASRMGSVQKKRIETELIKNMDIGSGINYTIMNDKDIPEYANKIKCSGSMRINKDFDNQSDIYPEFYLIFRFKDDGITIGRKTVKFIYRRVSRVSGASGIFCTFQMAPMPDFSCYGKKLMIISFNNESEDIELLNLRIDFLV